MSQQVHSSKLIGSNLIHKKEIESTNQFAKNLIAKNEPLHGSVILADFQTKGKGQASNQWQSNAGKNLLFSIILEPSEFKIQQQFVFNMAISLSILNALKQLLPNEDIAIKWPNDILINGKKCAGILIENFIKGKLISQFIIGIGLNVNQVIFNNLPNATSMKLVSGITYETRVVLTKVLAELNKLYPIIQTKPSQLKYEYLHALYQYQELADYKVGDSLKSGTILGVTEFGQLQIQFGNTIETFNNKEVEYVWR